MPLLEQDTLDLMIQNLPADQRRVLTDVLTGHVDKAVKCLSKSCKSRVIAYIYQDAPDKQRVVPSSESLDNMYLFQSRQRLDGQWGFHCKCGNNSIIAKHEQGIIGPHLPSKSDLEKIHSNLLNNKPNYPVINGKQKVDGFSIEDVK